MTDMENVIEGLKYCTEAGNNCNMSCPYYEIVDCEWFLKADAVNLLKTQEPRVMTLEEVQNAEIVWIEQVGELVAAMKVAASSKSGMINFAYAHDGGVFYVNIKPEYYGKISRCWNKKPTPEQMEATPWMKN